MKVVQKKLSDLQKIEKNIRRHTQKQLNEYVRSVKMFGQIRPLVVDEKGVILAGNGLYDAMVAIGWEKADCYVVTGLSEVEKKKLMLADNRVYELGMTDTDAFEEIIKSLDGDTDVPGWDADLLETLNATMHIVEIGIKLKRLVAQVYVHTPRIRRSKMSKSHYIILGNSLGSLFFATWCAA